MKNKIIKSSNWLIACIILIINCQLSNSNCQAQSITRAQIISNAVPYTTYTFTTTASNIKHSVSCSGVGNIITPSWVVVGNNTSMPYCWGGFSTQASFTSGLTHSKSAGDDDCTTGGDGSEGCALGVDCSGFVSRTWGRATKESTSTIPNISTALGSATLTQPGDCFNNAGSHVRLVETNYGNGNYRVIESSANGWHVAYNTYTASQLSAYVPRKYVNVAASITPVANFTASTTVACSGNAITMTDNSTNTPTSWNWTTTGGSPASSTSQNPSVTYNTAGTYTVTLIATNSSGASSPMSTTITVNANPSTPTIMISGSTLTSSSTTGNQWFLNSTAIGGATSQTYTATSNGSYTVVVTNSSGCTSTSAATTYSSGNAPVANFTASTLTTCAGQGVSLTDNSTNIPISWNWTTTGGSPASSSSQNPSINYSTAGTYTVTLVSTNSSGTSAPVSQIVTVNPNPSVPTIMLSGSTLTSSSTTGNQWYLNGAVIVGATSQTFTATSSGSYTIVVTNSSGCTSTSAATAINNGNPPVASFTASSSNCAGQAIPVTDNSTNTPTSWNWTLTGGTPATSTLQSPSITYNTAGTYTVTLVSSNSSGVSSPVSQTITINPSPAVPTISLVGSTFTSSATTDNQWYWNNILITGATNQTYPINANGAYTVTVSNSFGCSSTSTATNFNVTGINSIADNAILTIFPNPSNGFITINYTSKGKSEYINIEVINNLGQLVYTEKIDNCTNDCNKIIDMNSYQKGIYLVRIVADGDVHIKKVLLVK